MTHGRRHQQALDGRTDADRGREIRRRRGGAFPARRRVGRADLQRAVGPGAPPRPRLDRARCRCRRPGGHPRQHAPRVHARRPGGVDGRGDRRAGVPVELAGRVRVGRRQLRRPGHHLRERRPGRQDRPGPRRASRARAHGHHRRRGVRRDVDGRRGGAGRCGRRRGARTAGGRGRSRRRLPDHLHVGDDRPPEGRRADQQGVRRRTALGRGDGPVRPGRRRLPVPAAGPRLRPADHGRLRRGRRGDRLLGRRHDADRRRARRGEADGAAIGAADLREGLQRGDEHGAGRWRGGCGQRHRPRPAGAPGPSPWRRGLGRGRGGLREGRQRDVRPRPQHLRRTDQAGHLRRRADRPGDPRVLLRRRRPRVRRLGDDRDDVHRDAQPARRLQVRDDRPPGRPAPTCASPRTARSRWPAR